MEEKIKPDVNDIYMIHCDGRGAVQGQDCRQDEEKKVEGE
jgi:hypothetical protein